MIYALLVTVALVLVWGTAAFMSVCGLMAVFAGQAVVAGFLAAGMELGKLIVVVHLHRSWAVLGRWVKAAYMAVVMVLVALTAIEVGGYLIQSHRADMAALAVDRADLVGLVDQERVLRHRIAVVDDTLEQLPEGYVSRRINERRAAGYDGLQVQLADVLDDLRRVRVRIAAAEAAASPVIVVARLSGLNEPVALLVFVCFLVAVLEPLSIGLAVAASVAWGPGQRPAVEPAKMARPEKKAQSVDGSGLAENGQNDWPEKWRPENTSTDAFLAIVGRYDLDAEKLAEITGKKKISTPQGWLDGEAVIPEKAMRELRRWVQKRPRIVAGG